MFNVIIKLYFIYSHFQNREMNQNMTIKIAHKNVDLRNNKETDKNSDVCSLIL